MGSLNTFRGHIDQSNYNYGYYDNLNTLCDIIKNKSVDEFNYRQLITVIKNSINSKIVEELDNSGVHLIKSEYPVRNKMIKIVLNQLEKIVYLEKDLPKQIAYKIKEECGDDQVVVFWDLLKDIDIYYPHHNLTMSRYENNDIILGIICSYNIVNKTHNSVTPPKSIVKMLISNEKYEKNKF